MNPVTTILTFGAAPVQVSADPNVSVTAINFHLAKNAAGTAAIGLAGLNKATLVNVITELAPGDADFTVALPDASRRLHPADYWVDGVAGEHLVVTCWTA